MHTKETIQSKQPFVLSFTDPYTTFKDGKPQPIPYTVDGLLPEGGFSILSSKPKQGKSSLSRYLATCVAKGQPFLGRQTVKGEAILISLEDPQNHCDNCLSVLEYDPKTDAKIRIVDKLAPTLEENVSALADALTKLPDTRLIILDTLPKFLRVRDLSDYSETGAAMEQVRALARKFPRIHILGIHHQKKVSSADPQDGILGSTALRGEVDTNIALYSESAHRIIAAETRIGRAIPPTIIKAQLIESSGADVVRNFILDVPFDDWKSEQTSKGERKRKATYEERIITYLSHRNGESATQQLILEEVEGKTVHLLAAIQKLKDGDTVTVSGKKHSATEPLTITLNRDALGFHDFMARYNTEKE